MLRGLQEGVNTWRLFVRGVADDSILYLHLLVSALCFLQALDTFNTAVVSPIYYVMFTSLTILASVIMFKASQPYLFSLSHLVASCPSISSDEIAYIWMHSHCCFPHCMSVSAHITSYSTGPHFSKVVGGAVAGSQD